MNYEPAMFSTDEKLETLEKYLLVKFYGGIPSIPISFGTKEEMCGLWGCFCQKASDDYDEESMRDVPGYRSRYISLEIFGMAAGYTEYEDDVPYMDPLMHPELSIKISPEIKKDPLKITATLMHELAHYYCWYVGYDYDDDSLEFIRFLKDRDLPTNHDFIWNREDKAWTDTYDYALARPYFNAFLNTATAVI
ncbi:MAG: hypothetical protein K6E34_12995 [Lachnospiraceae bacterium]|nr:hypothetical protein [Lachnospiraceae bacterium]